MIPFPLVDPAVVAARYDAERTETLTAIREKRVSASMSGIEYYPKPWAELDPRDNHDWTIMQMALRWNGVFHGPEPDRAAAIAAFDALAKST